MHTLIDSKTSNATRELSADDLSAVTGGGVNDSGPTWSQLAAAADAATYAASSAVTGGGGVITTFAVEGVKSAVKQLRQ
jgi:hypothetical protein